MEVGSLVIRMAADVAKLRSDMDDAKRTVGSAMDAIKGSVEMAQKALIGLTGIASVAAFEGMVQGAIHGAAELHKLALQSGVTVEALSGLAAVGRATGTGADAIASASNKLSKSLATQSEESKGAAAAVAALGLNFDEIQKAAPDERIQKIAVAMSGFADDGQKSAAAMLLFGKAGAEMLPFLKDLASAGELHAKVTEEQARQAHEFEKALAAMKTNSDAWKKSLAMELLPTLLEITNQLQKMSSSTKDLGALLGEGLSEALRTVAALGANVAYVLKSIGIEIGGIAAQIAALTRNGFQGWKAVREEMLRDAQEARRRIDQQTTDLIGLTNSKAGAGRGSVNPELLGPVPEMQKKSLTGLDGSAKDKIDQQAKAYADLIARIKERIAIDEQEVALGRQLNEAERERLQIQMLVEKGTIRAKDAQSAKTKALLDTLDVATRERTQMLEAEAAEKAHVEAITKNAEAITDAVTKQKEANEQIGLNKYQIEQLTVARINDRAAEKDRQATLAATIYGVGSSEAQLYRQEAQDLRELAQLKAAGNAQQKQIDDFKAAWTSVDQTAHQAFTSMFNSGSNVFKRLTDMLRSTVLDLLYQMTLRKWVLQMTAQVTGASPGALAGVQNGMAAVPGVGGFAGVIGGTLKGLLGAAMGGGGAGGVYGPDSIDITPNWIKNMEGRASGGPVTTGVPYMVGENGPELWTPQSAGTITPNKGLGGPSIQISNVINVDSRSDKAQIESMVGNVLQANNRAIYSDLAARGVLA